MKNFFREMVFEVKENYQRWEYGRKVPSVRGRLLKGIKMTGVGGRLLKGRKVTGEGGRFV